MSNVDKPTVVLEESRVKDVLKPPTTTEELTKQVRELIKDDVNLTFSNIIDSIRGLGEEAFKEFVTDTSFAELMVEVVNTLESEVEDKVLMGTAQDNMERYSSENIGKRSALSNPDSGDSDEAHAILQELIISWNRAKQEGIPHIVIAKELVIQQAKEVSLIRERVEEIKISGEYKIYTDARGGKNALADEIREIQKKGKKYGFYPNFEINGTLGVYDRN